MPQNIDRILSGIVAFEDALGVYLLLTEERRFWVLQTVESLHALRGKRVTVHAKRVDDHILVAKKVVRG